MNDYQPSAELIAHVKLSEELVLVPRPDPVGIITYGWGHRSYPGEYVPPAITEDTADLLLSGDLMKASGAVRRLVTVELTQRQFDGLTDFSFNLGAAALERSTMLHFINREDWQGACAECHKWIHDHAGHVLPGLVTRRNWDADHIMPEDATTEWNPNKIIVNVPVVFPPIDPSLVPFVDPSPSLPAPGGGGDFAGAGASGEWAAQDPTVAPVATFPIAEPEPMPTGAPALPPADTPFVPTITEAAGATPVPAEAPPEMPPPPVDTPAEPAADAPSVP